jgi:hypothetical protein
MEKNVIAIVHPSLNITVSSMVASLQIDGPSAIDVQSSVDNLEGEVSEVLVYIGATSEEREEWATRVADVCLAKFPKCSFLFNVCDCAFRYSFSPEGTKARNKPWGQEGCELCMRREAIRKQA